MSVHFIPFSIAALLLLGGASTAAPLSASRALNGANIEPAAYLYTGADYSVAVSDSRPTLIGRFNDSCQHHAPPMLSGTAEHGVVTTKEGVRRACGNSAEPVTEVWYRPEPGFHGVDHVTLTPYRSYITVTVR
jgi:hypothetical protein